jgi:hypothetical protein
MKTKADFKKKEKGLGGKKRVLVKIITVALSILALLVTFNYMNTMADKTQRTVEVVRVKSNLKNNGIITYELISKDNVEVYKLVEKEYDKATMVLWENVEEIYDKYAAHFIRKATILYKDQLINEKPASYIPLEELPDNEELLTFPYNSSRAGGNILRPGDRVRIRISYEAERRIEPSDEENPNARVSIEKYLQTDTIFDSIIITDMLNSNNNSIYTVYQEAMRLDEKQRQEMMKSSDFLSAVKPKALLLAATDSDVQNYAKYEAMSGTILITILRREEGTIDWGIMPFLIENEVGTWTDESK